MPAPVPVEQGEDLVVKGDDGDLRLRVLRPESARGIYLHLHGGGWVLGSAIDQEPLLWDLAVEAGITVVGLDYRLAPEHPHPAAIEDCVRAARWLAGDGGMQLGGGPLALGGRSAGAHLALLTALRLRDDAEGVAPICGMNLVYGVYDLTMTPSQRTTPDSGAGITRDTMRWFYDCFLPGVGVDGRRAADVSPLYADLQGLPPALFTVGTADLLRDDTLFLEARWRMAGSRAELDVYEGGLHGFTGYPISIARRAWSQQTEFLRSCFSHS